MADSKTLVLTPETFKKWMAQGSSSISENGILRDLQEGGIRYRALLGHVDLQTAGDPHTKAAIVRLYDEVCDEPALLDRLAIEHLLSPAAKADFARKAMKRCAQCAQRPGVLLRCGRCKLVLYCSRNCQEAHWKKHKGVCVASAD